MRKPSFKKRIIGKKAITEVVFVLIISGIAIAMLFLGVMGAYKSFAVDLGVNFTASSLIQKPRFGTAGKIIVTNVEQANMSSILCHDECYLDNHVTVLECSSPTPPANCTAMENCKSSCDSIYDVGYNYSKWIVSFEYRGMNPSKLNLKMLEKRLKNGVVMESMIYTEEPPYTYAYGGNYNVSIIKQVDKTCQGNVTLLLDALSDSNEKVYYSDDSKPENLAPFTASYPFCATAPERNINVSVDFVTFSYPNIYTNVSITGSDVAEYCPNANAMFVITNKLGMEKSLLCTFNIDTDKGVSGDWLNPLLKYRVSFNLTNVLGRNITQLETASVILNLDEVNLGTDLDMTDEACMHSIAIVEKGTTNALLRNVTILTNNFGFCERVRVDFVINPPFNNTETKYFYAYFNETGYFYSQDEADVLAHYPSYTIGRTGLDENYMRWDFLKNSSENCTVWENTVELKDVICQGAST